MLTPKVVLPVLIACAIAGPLSLKKEASFSSSSSAEKGAFSEVEPSAGATDVPEGSVPGAPEVTTAQITHTTIIPPLSETELENSEGMTVSSPTVKMVEESSPLKITPDKPEVVHLDKDAVNVIVGSEEHLRVIPDTNRTLIVIPKKPGATFFKALDGDGNVIMQRHVIIAAPQKKYIRVRRACAEGDTACKEFSVYYCPDMCHEVSVVQGDTATQSPAAPGEVSSGAAEAPSAPPVEPMR